MAEKARSQILGFCPNASSRHVPSSELQQTLLSVTRAILPLSPVPISHLFHSIRITYPIRAVHLYRRLRPRKRNNTDLSGNNAANLVKEFSVECWSVGADFIVNLVHLLPKLFALRFEHTVLTFPILQARLRPLPTPYNFRPPSLCAKSVKEPISRVRLCIWLALPCRNRGQMSSRHRSWVI